MVKARLSDMETKQGAKQERSITNQQLLTTKHGLTTVAIKDLCSTRDSQGDCQQHMRMEVLLCDKTSGEKQHTCLFSPDKEPMTDQSTNSRRPTR